MLLGYISFLCCLSNKPMGKYFWDSNSSLGTCLVLLCLVLHFLWLSRNVLFFMVVLVCKNVDGVTERRLGLHQIYVDLKLQPMQVTAFWGSKSDDGRLYISSKRSPCNLVEALIMVTCVYSLRWLSRRTTFVYSDISVSTTRLQNWMHQEGLNESYTGLRTDHAFWVFKLLKVTEAAPCKNGCMC